MLARGYSVSTRLPGMQPASNCCCRNLRRSSLWFLLAGRAQSIYSIPAESICQDCFQPLDIRCPTDEAERFSLVESFVSSFDAVGSPEASRRTLESVNPSSRVRRHLLCLSLIATARYGVRFRWRSLSSCFPTAASGGHRNPQPKVPPIPTVSRASLG